MLVTSLGVTRSTFVTEINVERHGLATFAGDKRSGFAEDINRITENLNRVSDETRESFGKFAVNQSVDINDFYIAQGKLL